jgi:hypothetical protein
MGDLRSVATSNRITDAERRERYLLLGVVALRLYLGSSWGMSRRGRRDVEEGIVRVEYSGVYELGDIGHIVIDIGLGFVTWGR